MKKIYVLLTILILLFSSYLFLLPVKGQFIEIKKGDTLKTVMKKIEKGIYFPKIFYIIVRLKGINLKTGYCDMRQAINNFHLFMLLKKNIPYLYTVTIPPGLTIKEIAKLLERKRIIKYRRFYSKCNDKIFIKKILGKDFKSFEGYLYPDTYKFTLNEDPEVIIVKMLENLKKHLLIDLNIENISSKDFYNNLIIASLLEKEAALIKEKKLISSVIHNRLKKNINLCLCTTVIYALKKQNKFDGNLRKKDLTIKSSYNTYIKKGLPPGPICMPSIDSIKAALNPTPTQYMYFVSKNNGEHKFSVTYREHINATNKYQKHRWK